MKKILCILLFACLTCSSSSFAFDPLIVCSGAPASGGTTCSGDYGETVDGTSATADNAGFTKLLRVTYGCTAASNDTTFYFRTSNAIDATHQVVMLIYSDNAGEPGELVWQSTPLYNAAWSTATWISQTVNVSLSGDYLWIGCHLQDASNKYYYTSNSPARDSRYINNGGTFPDVDSNWDVDNDTVSTYGLAVYLNY